MNKNEIDNLIEVYKDYPNSEIFIKGVYECFKNRKSDFHKKFIHAVFRNNNIKDCYFETFLKLSAHWNNIAFDKLQQCDYDNYFYTCLTVANYRIIANYLENKVY